jgi:hypothetical protein
VSIGFDDFAWVEQEAERSESGNGRVYAITVGCIDAASNNCAKMVGISTVRQRIVAEERAKRICSSSRVGNLYRVARPVGVLLTTDSIR